MAEIHVADGEFGRLYVLAGRFPSDAAFGAASNPEALSRAMGTALDGARIEAVSLASLEPVGGLAGYIGQVWDPPAGTLGALSLPEGATHAVLIQSEAFEGRPCTATVPDGLALAGRLDVARAARPAPPLPPAEVPDIARALRGGAWGAMLEPGESVVWEGRPIADGPLSRRNRGATLAVLGALVAVAALIFLLAPEDRGAAILVPAFVVAAVVLAVALPRLGLHRRGTRYALTERRALVRSPMRGARAYRPDDPAEVILRPAAGRSHGTVLFARRSGGRAAAFEHVEDAEAVAARLRAMAEANAKGAR